MSSPRHSSAPPRLQHPPPTTPLGQSYSQFQFLLPSPESRGALERSRRRIEGDIKHTDLWLQENQVAGCTRFQAEMVDQTISKVEVQLEETMELHSKLLRAVPSPSGKRAASREALHESTTSWAREARRRNWACVREAPPAVALPPAHYGAAHLERVKLPHFDGKPENWSEFKRRFKELTKAVNCSPVMEMTFLVDHLADEAARYVLGVTDPTEAWALLDRRYGDRRLAIMTARHRLVNLQLPAGPAHVQVEDLVQGLRHALTCMRAVDAEEELFSDLAMVGILLAKLPPEVQARWYSYRVGFPASTSASEDGRYLQKWLDHEGEAAILQRLTLLGTELARPPTHTPREEEEEVEEVVPPRDLRGSAATYTTTTTSPSTTTGASLLDVASVSVHSPSPSLRSSTSTLMLTDSGSTETFILHSLARQLMLPSTPTTLQVKVLGQPTREVATRVYQLFLEDSRGTKHKVEAVGLDSLAEVPPCPQASSLTHLFPGAPTEAAAAFTRPHGTVGLLLGQRHRALHSRDAGYQADNLRLAKSKFGWTLTGHSPHLATTAPSSSNFILASQFQASEQHQPHLLPTSPITTTRPPLKLKSGVYYCSC